jgi:hypothetical protein
MLNPKYKSSLFAIAILIFLYTGNIAGETRRQEDSNDDIASDRPIQPNSFKHIILTWQDSPATSQAVTWRTDVPLKQAVAEIALSDPSPDFASGARQSHALTSTLETGQGSSYYHSVNFTDLRPDSLYAYRVGNGNVWSEWFQFRTASDKSKPFSFIYLADAQYDIYSLWSRTVRAAFLEAPKARFMIHTGDLVNQGDSDRQWREWFEAGGWILAMIPSIPVTGNHEYMKQEPGRPSLSKYWKLQFTLPEADRKGLDETVYFVDYQGVRVVALNSNLAIKDQAKWLENLLKNNPNGWTIIALHHPIYSSAHRRNNKELIKYWKPVFEKYKVDLVLQGHDHVYGRGRGVCSEEEDCQGPIYVTSVSGPGMYRLDGRSWMDRAAENTQLFQVISISGNRLDYRSITVSGEVYDAFELIKKEKTRLINKIPADAPAYRFDNK